MCSVVHGIYYLALFLVRSVCFKNIFKLYLKVAFSKVFLFVIVYSKNVNVKNAIKTKLEFEAHITNWLFYTYSVYIKIGP